MEQRSETKTTPNNESSDNRPIGDKKKVQIYNENNRIKQSENGHNENIEVKSNNSEAKNPKKDEDKSSNSSSNPKICCCSVECVGIFFLIAAKLITVSLFPNIIMIIGLSVSTYKNKECQAEIYSKINLIFLGTYILLFLESLGGVLDICVKKGENDENSSENHAENSCCLKCIFVYHILDKILSFVLVLFLLIITQLYYTSSTSWEKCGSVKGWLTYTLVILYIEVIVNSFGLIILIIVLILLCLGMM